MKKSKYSTKLCRPIVNLSQESVERFHQSYTKSDGCWEWTNRLNSKGYAFMGYTDENGVHHTNILATRISYFLAHGECAQVMHVLHRCDNPKCVRPDHLFLGTHQENMQDMGSKGRNFTRIGQDNFQCRLTPEKVLEIRELSKQGLSSIKIGARFGVSKTSILMILNGRTWGHVQSPDSHA